MNRTTYTKNQRIERLGKTDANNMYMDRHTGEKMTLKDVHLGHKQYFEDRYFRESGDLLGMDQKTFNKCMRNMGDEIFQPESAQSNLSHVHECKDYDIGMNNCLRSLKNEWIKLEPENEKAIDKKALEARKSIMIKSHEMYEKEKARALKNKEKADKMKAKLDQKRSEQLGKNNSKITSDKGKDSYSFGKGRSTASNCRNNSSGKSGHARSSAGKSTGTGGRSTGSSGTGGRSSGSSGTGGRSTGSSGTGGRSSGSSGMGGRGSGGSGGGGRGGK